MFAYQITAGHYGRTDLAGLNVGAVIRFDASLPPGGAAMGLLLDDRASPDQAEALTAIFAGAAGGWPAEFACMIGDFRGVEVAPVRIEIARDLSTWSIEVSGRYVSSSAALTGPTANPSKRVQLINVPASEVGPGGHRVATWATGNIRQTDAVLFGDFRVEMKDRSSKHIEFDWSGPDQ
jgi:hypothetical protein